MSTVTFETKHLYVCLFRIILIFLFFNYRQPWNTQDIGQGLL